MSEFSIKSAIEVAIKKEIEVPDEATGLVLYEATFGCIKGDGDELETKSAKDFVPTDKHMELINSRSLEPQAKENWMIIKGVRPLGPKELVDSHGDYFEAAAERDMASQAFWTPILVNHDHHMNPPIGRVIEATAGKGGLKETWAIPLDSYNSDYVAAIKNGNMSEISIGAFIDAKDKVCSACSKSIYDMECSHIPNRIDPKTGNTVSVAIKRVKKYAERSLVNIPARAGTGVKEASSAPEQENILDHKFEEGSPEDRLQESINSLKEALATATDSGEKFEEAIKGALELAFPTEDEENTNWIAYAKITKAPSAQDPPLIFDLPFDYEKVGIQILVPEGKDLTGANSWGIQNFITDKAQRVFKFNATGTPYLFQSLVEGAYIPQLKIDHTLIPDNPSINEGNFVLTVYVSRKEAGATPPATISDVINEDSIVAEKDVKSPEAQEPSEKEEVAPVEAPAAEDKAQAPAEEVKSVEVPVVKSLEIEELTKSFQEPVVKALAEFNEKFAQLHELQEKNAKDLGALTETVTKIAQHVVELSQFSSEDVINQVIELVSQLKDQKSAEPTLKAPDNFNDFVSSLVAKK